MVDIVRRGKALYVGISRWPAEAAATAYSYLAARDVPCLIYQGRYNIFDRAPETDGTLAQAAAEGAGYICFSPLAQGLLTDRYLGGIPADSRIAHGGHLKKESLTPATLSRIAALNDLAGRRGQTLAQMALSWVLRDNAVTSVLVGASSTQQLADSLRALEATPFTNDELKEIDDICK